ncbi:MAG: hypothetical protein AseanaTS_18580 [Candidatus Pelagadaptatus aseana]
MADAVDRNGVVTGTGCNRPAAVVSVGIGVVIQRNFSGFRNRRTGWRDIGFDSQLCTGIGTGIIQKQERQIRRQHRKIQSIGAFQVFDGIVLTVLCRLGQRQSVIPVFGNHILVVISAAFQSIVTETAIELVITSLSTQGVIALTTDQGISTVTTVDGVVTAAAVEYIVQIVTGKGVIERRTDNIVDPR